MNQNDLERLLITGLQSQQLVVPVEPLLQYLTLLYKWNQAYNLTAIRDIETMVTRHLLDSLAILPFIQGERILDVGTGAGFPGIPLAIAMPKSQITLLDSNGKKIRFLREVKRILALDNVEIIQSRAEAYRPTEGFDTVTSRAFSDLKQMIQWTQHLITEDGIWLAMKGRVPEAELATITQSFRIEPYIVTGVEGERCCVIMHAKMSTEHL